MQTTLNDRLERYLSFVFVYLIFWVRPTKHISRNSIMNTETTDQKLDRILANQAYMESMIDLLAMTVSRLDEEKSLHSDLKNEAFKRWQVMSERWRKGSEKA